MLRAMELSAPSKGPSGHRSPKRRGPHLAAPPAVDERLVMPETRYEIIDGRVEYVPPADQAHGSRHSKVSALLELYAAAGYDVACDMLTRTSEKGDMAPDASVYPAALDARTGGRRLEELAFEVVSTERLSHAATKARALTARGVRRVFAIDVERKRALAWSTATDAWEILSPEATIEDAALALPLPIRALVEAAKTDDAAAYALLAKKNPVIEGALSAARQEANARGEERGKKLGAKLGLLAGKRAALLAVLTGRGLKVSKKADKRIRAEPREASLDAWLRRAATCGSVDELLGGTGR
jgi:Uma2 family endonuclease